MGNTVATKPLPTSRQRHPHRRTTLCVRPPSSPHVLDVSFNPSTRVAFTLVHGLAAMAVLHITNNGLVPVQLCVKPKHSRYYVVPMQDIVHAKRSMAVAIHVSARDGAAWIEAKKKKDTADGDTDVALEVEMVAAWSTPPEQLQPIKVVTFQSHCTTWTADDDCLAL
ncbi:hypothetical protein DYB30_008938 [Aphanomyces astaci]|nr:hypothetical protein DYB30_008938 [Aphanomyces astaci]RHZ05114.1 hypothetical protein DYB31_008399 [Aphanomyces astaci]RQM30258.1 hypothetical protein B5M09_013041 [Aphanomyces astaci]